MTRKLNNANGLQDWKTEHQAVTASIGNFSASLQNSPYLRPLATIQKNAMT